MRVVYTYHACQGRFTPCPAHVGVLGDPPAVLKCKIMIPLDILIDLPPGCILGYAQAVHVVYFGIL